MGPIWERQVDLSNSRPKVLTIRKDPGGTWAFGDGTSFTGIFGNYPSHNVTHAYSSTGSYAVTFTVTDLGGLTSTATTTATIQ